MASKPQPMKFKIEITKQGMRKKVALPGTRWRMQVRRKGQQCSQTFTTYKSAEEWGKRIEIGVEEGKSIHAARVDLSKVRIADLIATYAEKKSSKLRAWENIAAYHRKWLAQPWAQLTLDSPAIEDHIQVYVDSLGVLKKNSMDRETDTLIRHFRWAKQVLRWPVHAPIVNKPEYVNLEADHREIVWRDDQLAYVLDDLGFDENKAPETVRQYLGWVILILRHNGGLRLGSACKLPVGNVRADTNVVFSPAPNNKNGKHYRMPATDKGIYWLRKLAEHRRAQDAEPDELLVPVLTNSLSREWGDIKNNRYAVKVPELELHLLNLHDLRHTWTTEWAPIIADLDELAKMTGRSDLKVLRKYINTTPEQLVARANKKAARYEAAKAGEAAQAAGPAFDQATLMAALQQLLAAQQAVQQTATPKLALVPPLAA